MNTILTKWEIKTYMGFILTEKFSIGIHTSLDYRSRYNHDKENKWAAYCFVGLVKNNTCCTWHKILRMPMRRLRISIIFFLI